MPSNFTLPQKLEADVSYPSGQKIKTFRREYSTFFKEFEDWWRKANIGQITAMTQSENAAGWITLTVAYFEAGTSHHTPQPRGDVDRD